MAELACQQLWQQALTLLRAQPEGLSEYQLLCQLKEVWPSLSRGLPADTVELFQLHFRLFHTLYSGRLHWLPAGEGLSISALSIRWFRTDLSPSEGAQAVVCSQESPALVAFYLDGGNFERIGRAQLEGWLGNFWRLLAQPDARRQACHCLGLTDGVSQDAIKAAYRRLAAQHHPDRGGDIERFREVRAAYECLCP